MYADVLCPWRYIGKRPDRVAAVLDSDDYAEQVRTDRRRTAEHGVTGVPSLVIDGGPPVPGVRPVAELHRLLGRGPAESAATN